MCWKYHCNYRFWNWNLTPISFTFFQNVHKIKFGHHFYLKKKNCCYPYILQAKFSYDASYWRNKCMKKLEMFFFTFWVSEWDYRAWISVRIGDSNLQKHPLVFWWEMVPLHIAMRNFNKIFLSEAVDSILLYRFDKFAVKK